MKTAVQWVLRRAGLYVLLVLALAFGPIIFHAVLGSSLREELMSPREVSARFQRLRSESADAFARTRAEVAAQSGSTLTARLAQAQAELADVNEELGAKQGWFASIRPRLILERKALDLRRAALNGEIHLLERAVHRDGVRSELQSVMTPTEGAIATARQRCEAANLEARRFNTRPTFERSVRNVLTAEARRLTDEAAVRCAEYQIRVRAREAAMQRVRDLRADLAGAEDAYDKAALRSQEAIAGVQVDLTRTVRGVLLNAAILLATILATPYLVRVIFYFWLAPLVGRRPAVRLRGQPGSTPAPSILQRASATSAPITLGPAEELLVRQGFLQSTSSIGAKSTQALLDWRHPFSSLAAGLAFLTRVRGEGEVTTVSAVRDPLAEVAVLKLPVGAACVLHPRALAAVVQRTGQPVRITSHWRLASLHAWLTLQLRFLIFHGPALLVIKGGRGVRVEQAQQGRVLGQDQLIGFSTDLAYSVTRTETFWPYFLGMEQLLKDKVEAGRGVLIVEEAPMASAGRRRRGGLEGAADVALKAVGL